MTSADSLEPIRAEDLPIYSAEDIPSVTPGEPAPSLWALLCMLLPRLWLESGLSATAYIVPLERIPPYYSISFLCLSASASSNLALSIYS